MSIPSTPPRQDAPAQPTAAEIARLLDIILDGVLRQVAARGRLLGLLLLPLWNRISAARVRLIRLLGHLAAGRLPRRRGPRPANPRPVLPAPAAPRLSRARGWVARTLGPDLRGHAAQMAHLLATPGVAAAIAASPGAARTLRPLCHILGIDLPAELRLPPRPPAPRPVRKRPPRPSPPPEPPLDPPLQDYVLAAVRYWRRRHPHEA